MKVLDEKARRIITASYALPDLESAVQQGGVNIRMQLAVLGVYTMIGWTVIYNAIDAHAKTIKLVVDVMTTSFTAVDDGKVQRGESVACIVGPL